MITFDKLMQKLFKNYRVKVDSLNEIIDDSIPKFYGIITRGEMPQIYLKSDHNPQLVFLSLKSEDDDSIIWVDHGLTRISKIKDYKGKSESFLANPSEWIYIKPKDREAYILLKVEQQTVPFKSKYSHHIPKRVKKYLETDDEERGALELIEDKLPEIIGEETDKISQLRKVNQHIHSKMNYSIVPSVEYDRVARMIKSIPLSMRKDAFQILARSYNLRHDYLKEVGDSIQIPDSIVDDPQQISKYLLDRAYEMWGEFQVSWWETKLKDSVSSNSGKCVQKSKLFVAISKKLGIPAVKLDGYGGNEYYVGSPHAWAAYYNDGWVEVDPTWGEFEDFSQDKHLIELSNDVKTRIDSAIALPYDNRLVEDTKYSDYKNPSKEDAQPELSNYFKGFRGMIRKLYYKHWKGFDVPDIGR